MIEIQGVSKAFGQTAALHSINLTIPAGQTTHSLARVVVENQLYFGSL